MAGGGRVGMRSALSLAAWLGPMATAGFSRSPGKQISAGARSDPLSVLHLGLQ